MTKAKANKIALRVAVFLLAVLLVSYLVYQVVQYTAAPYKTELAVSQKITDDVAATGIAVRSETVLAAKSGDIYDYRITDGDRIAKGAVIARMYSSVAEVNRVVLLERLTQERDFLIKLQNSGSGTADISSSKSNLLYALSGLSSAASGDSFSGISDQLTAAKSSLASFYRQISRDADYGSRISELNVKIAELQESASSAAGVMIAPEAGYFMTHTDGYEKTVNTENIMGMTASEVLALTETEPTVTESPKLVNNYIWYFAAVVDNRSAIRFSVGQQLTLNFNYEGVTGLPCDVVKVAPDDASGKTLVIFEVQYFNAATAALRVENVSISFRNYSGIVIPRSALRIEDGKTGVYIKYGSEVKFVTIDIAFETDTYVLASDSGKTGDTLQIYDEIITEGRGLYVGKEIGN